MITAPTCLRAATLSLMLTSLVVAGDTPDLHSAGDRATSAQPCKDRARRALDGLNTRRPYQPGKVPVVFIHGLWGDPRLWEPMIAALETNPALQTRYQFWTFAYASGDSIPYSAHLLRQSLRRARRVFDPGRTDTAFDQMALVGHSLGGILTKMMAQNSGSRLWQTVSARPIDQLTGPPEDCRLLTETFCYQRVPEVRRVVFIATPHRGSPLAGGPLRGLGARICVRTNPFVRAIENTLARNEPGVFAPSFLAEVPTSAGELVPGHPLLVGLCDLGIDPSVRSHSIIADLRNPPGPGATDGLVPYSSSHLDGVASELLVHGLHICLNHPAVIEEVRRILIEHAADESVARSERRSPGRQEIGRSPVPRSQDRGSASGVVQNLRGFLTEVQP